MTPEQIFGIIFASLFVFVLIREVICWYFKVNERVNQNKLIIAELVKLNTVTHDPVEAELIKPPYP